MFFSSQDPTAAHRGPLHLVTTVDIANMSRPTLSHGVVENFVIHEGWVVTGPVEDSREGVLMCFEYEFEYEYASSSEHFRSSRSL